jgi:hypothetical protein
MDTQTFTSYDDHSYRQFSNPSLIHKDLEHLCGIISGIQGDHVINAKEHAGLNSWLEKTKPYETKQPYKAVIELIRDAVQDDHFTEDEGNNIVWFCNQYLKKNRYFDELTAGILKLQGIVKGIAIDKEINLAELEYLDLWLESNEYLKNTWPYDELYNITTNIIRDRIITPDEHDEILKFCTALSSFADDDASNSESLTTLSSGFFQVDPDITFQERTFCLTGVSKKFKRKEIADKIELYGGFVQNNISAKLNYLVVCDEKNTCWAFSCYGRKIEEAMNHRKQGKQIVIVHEFDLFDAFQKFD